MKAEKIATVGINVKNLDEAERFFSDLLGIMFVRIPIEESRKIKVAISPIGLDLIESVPPLEKEGLRAIDVKVPDIEQAKAEMKKKGIPLVLEATMGDVKEAIYNVYGVRLVLMEYDAPDMVSAFLGKSGGCSVCG